MGKGGVTIGFLSTEVKIDVGADAGKVESVQDIDERDRIGSSAQGDDDLGSFWQQMLRFDVLFDGAMEHESVVFDALAFCKDKNKTYICGLKF